VTAFWGIIAVPPDRKQEKPKGSSRMAKVHEQLSPDLQQFIRAQHMFFVASAPLSAEGHINLSPKGSDSFRILGPNQVCYLDMTGSGNETSAHLMENGRVTLMFCAFDGAPNILRLFGRGRTVLPGASEWDSLCALFAPRVGVRQFIVVDVARVQTSCGFGVPLYAFVADRTQMPDWAEKKGEAGLEVYRKQKNVHSIDGLPTPLGEALEKQ
jgi:hypothetical protein